MSTVLLHHRYQTSLTAAAEYDNPLYDCEATVTLSAPSGRKVDVDAFWDGGTDWCFAVAPNEEGAWNWRVASSTDDGLNGQTGSFVCMPYDGDNPLYQHGPLQVAATGTYLEHCDETPFFWLADTAWNGVLRGGDSEWADYLAQRRRQGFTAIQVVATHWRGEPCDAEGETACTEEYPARINPAFFRRIDRRMAMINEHGLLAVPVMLWSLLESDPGRKMDERDVIRVARYVAARYGAYSLAWFLGGDGDYTAMGIDRWKRIGRAVFENRHSRLVTLHSCGQSWVGDAFRDESWYDFIGYQSGHGDGAEHLEWLTRGPTATAWANAPAKPVINLEPNYECALGYQHTDMFSAYHIRRASYWSMLQTPVAGISYGHDSVWNWNAESGPSVGHGSWALGCVPPWSRALETDGVESLRILRDVLADLPWWTMRPAPERLVQQPGEEHVKRHLVVSATDDERVTLVYSPLPQPFGLKSAEGCVAEWINPRTGTREPAKPKDGLFWPPASEDWLLLLHKDE